MISSIQNDHEREFYHKKVYNPFQTSNNFYERRTVISPMDTSYRMTDVKARFDDTPSKKNIDGFGNPMAMRTGGTFASKLKVKKANQTIKDTLQTTIGKFSNFNQTESSSMYNQSEKKGENQTGSDFRQTLKDKAGSEFLQQSSKTTTKRLGLSNQEPSIKKGQAISVPKKPVGTTEKPALKTGAFVNLTKETKPADEKGKKIIGKSGNFETGSHAKPVEIGSLQSMTKQSIHEPIELKKGH